MAAAATAAMADSAPAAGELVRLWPACNSCQAPCVPPLRLHDDFPRRKWQPRSGVVPTDALHWGQRKLLLTEVAFLTQHAKAGDTVLYVGAAPGEHILLLACCLFPHLKFHCVDPRPMAFSATEPPCASSASATDTPGLHPASASNVTQEQALFSAADAAKWHSKAHLVISDLRSQQDEQGVKDDMALQDAIVRAVQPRAALLKFRLPWGPGTTEYLCGDVHLQPYAQGRSTETRLWVTDCASKRKWDHEAYEDRLFWFNTELRASFRPPSEAGLSLAGGAPTAWDGWAEMAIWQAYMDSEHATCAKTAEHPSSQGLVARAARGAPSGAAAQLAWAATSLLCCFKAADSNRTAWLTRAQVQRKRPRADSSAEGGGGASAGAASAGAGAAVEDAARCWLCALRNARGDEDGAE